jgi:plastocyanin
MAVVLAWAGVACGGEEAGPTGPTTTAPTETDSPTEEPTEDPTQEPTGPTVDLVNFMFDPARIDAAPGSTLTIRNPTPTTPHTFTVEDIDVTLDPMSTTEVTLDLGPGNYDVICRFHEGQGMTATLRVESI